MKLFKNALLMFALMLFTGSLASDLTSRNLNGQLISAAHKDNAVAVKAPIATTLLPLQSVNPVEQLVSVMISNSDTEHQCSAILTQKRKLSDYQDVYNLAIKHPKLLKGIIHDGQTFAMLCVQRGCADVLERLINEGYLVDLATPCNLCGPREPETTVLHRLLGEVSMLRNFKEFHSEDYIERITGLTKLIINKYPDLLDIPVNRARTARNQAIFFWNNVSDLIPGDLPQS